jgi:hypothetical protein
MRKFLYLCILSGLILSLSSCKDKKTEKETSVMEEIIKSNSRYDVKMTRTADDSTTIVKMATQYLDLLQQNKIDEALDMLYEINESSEMQSLSDTFRAVLKNNLKKFPVLSYSIDDFHLYTDNDVDVRYTYEFMTKPEGSPENLPTTMRGVLSPVRINGNWYLTVSEFLKDPEMNNMENSKYSSIQTEDNEDN